MNKEELLEMVQSLDLPIGEYYILGGGALVISGIRKKTADLDLCVSEDLFFKLKEKYNLSKENKNECGFYKINNMIEIVPAKKIEFTMQKVDGIYIEDLNRILKFKKARNLPKDQNDIKNIEEFLKLINNK